MNEYTAQPAGRSNLIKQIKIVNQETTDHDLQMQSNLGFTDSGYLEEERRNQPSLLKTERGDNFTIKHFSGPVTYSSRDFTGKLIQLYEEPYVMLTDLVQEKSGHLK